MAVSVSTSSSSSSSSDTSQATKRQATINYFFSRLPTALNSVVAGCLSYQEYCRTLGRTEKRWSTLFFYNYIGTMHVTNYRSLIFLIQSLQKNNPQKETFTTATIFQKMIKKDPNRRLTFDLSSDHDRTVLTSLEPMSAIKLCYDNLHTLPHDLSAWRCVKSHVILHVIREMQTHTPHNLPPPHLRWWDYYFHFLNPPYGPAHFFSEMEIYPDFLQELARNTYIPEEAVHKILTSYLQSLSSTQIIDWLNINSEQPDSALKKIFTPTYVGALITFIARKDDCYVAFPSNLYPTSELLLLKTLNESQQNHVRQLMSSTPDDRNISFLLRSIYKVVGIENLSSPSPDSNQLRS